ncbi:hypothetical protein [Streptomyces barringtoniae]|uniref:hypothetical protein n=1 Tax=Streptomyces barringtoniae TaxID=2892029 RepID=UPI001E65DA8C|nr:hypothetical protein [Streptomyces barringtoniae]MCC5480621.1 hypothetical protein [Streptomyces barringtoniae]
MPDHFDRLVGRTAPAAAASGGADGAADTGVVRVRPRLPGPFERMDAFGARVNPFGPDLEEREPAEPARRTESTTVRHTAVEAAPRHDLAPVRPAVRQLPSVLREQTAPQHGVLMPAAVPQPVPEPSAGPARRSAAEDGRGDPSRRATDSGRPTAETTVRRESFAARQDTAQRPVAAVPAQTARPAARPAAPAAGRQSARDTTGRRTPERTVHISIARLEVRAASRGGAVAAPRPSERAQRAGRPSPVLSLEKYLSRGEAQR